MCNNNNCCCCPPNYDFTSTITPLTSLTPPNVQFRMRRRNKVITLQWQPFTGTLSQAVAFLTITNTIPNLPPYTITYPVIYTLNGTTTTGYFYIDPSTVGARFYLHTDSSVGAVNDTISFTGGSVTWIIQN